MVTQPAVSPKVLCAQQQMVRIHRTRSINLTQIELDSLIRALQFEADAMTAQAAGVRGKRRSLLVAIAEANQVLIAILKAEWGEP
jgi:hypothetical protein